MKALLKQLGKEFPQLTFKEADTFYWSPKDASVYYVNGNNDRNTWSLLHETSHGALNHKTFTTDYELLQLELAAWEKAKEIGEKYDVIIDPDHIEDCLDTYRNWLHKRSLCPDCNVKALQKASQIYQCINCDQEWQVSSSRFCRPYRIRTT